jgi:N-acetylneuraminate synthase
MQPVHIGNTPVGDGYPVFVIAEIGINHNGSITIAKELIDAAVAAGCNAVKFQKREVATVYTAAELAQPRKVDPSFIDHVVERIKINGAPRNILPESALARLMVDKSNTTNGDLKYALEFELKEFDIIDLYCQERGIPWFASAWDGLSAHFLNGFNVPAHKIASACLTHADLLRRVRSNKKPVILSTGGSTLQQVQKAVDILGEDNLILLHCVANYPCAEEEVNLGVIQTLRDIFPNLPVGWSGHELGLEPSLAAVSMGACVIERHITLDRTMPGSDQKASLEPGEFARLVARIRDLESSQTGIEKLVSAEQMAKYRGSGHKRVLPSEIPVMEKLRRVTDF